MHKTSKATAIAVASIISLPTCANNMPAATSQPEKSFIMSTDAYRWIGDTIFQKPFKAYAASPFHIISDYSAQPGYYMGVDKEWKLKNDISQYPRLSTPNKLHQAIFNMGLDEMVNAVEPDTTLRTGREWPGVWTRDVSYSIILAMAALQPEASRISLEHKITPNGRIIQDTGSGGAWPVSSDRQIWGIAAFEVYKTTGDRKWLEKIYPVMKNSLEDDYKTIVDKNTGLVRGETSFIDWREQSYPRWMQTADIYQSQALGTSVVHAQAWRTLAEIARLLGHENEAATFSKRAEEIANAVNRNLWMADKGYYAMYLYGRNNLISNPRAETLGEALAILYDVASPQRAKEITEHNPTTPFGVAIFYPQISDQPPYHNNALWPWVAAYWALANAKAGNEEGVVQAIGSIFRPAALFATNKENFVLDNGDIATQLNSSNMLWCLSGNIAVTMKILFGVTYETNGISFHPFVPESLAATRTLEGLKYRNSTINISISGHGSEIAEFYLNGQRHEPFIPATLTGKNDIRIVMADNDIPPMKVNEVANAKAPLTPIAWLSHDPALAPIEGAPANNRLQWNPIEYIGHYIVLRDGKPVAETRQTSFEATVPGEYQVIGVSSDGTESFASQPASNQPAIFIDFTNEHSAIMSQEALNLAANPVEGYFGNGFIEVDHTTTGASATVEIPDAGNYAVTLRYANGNGPVNTENRCAIRTLAIDGKPTGTIVMPQRGSGNWSDWGESNSLEITLPAGRHTIAVEFMPENENMNFKVNHALIDRIILRKLSH